MKHSGFYNAALALTAFLALASAPVHGASVRGGTTTSDSRVAAQGTVAQSTQQEGTLDSNASAHGAARRPRAGSFIAQAIEAARRMFHPDDVVEKHIADATLFIRNTHRESRFFLTPEESMALERNVSDLIVYGSDFFEVRAAFDLVNELSKTDEEALHALFLLANYRSVFWLKVDKPQFIKAIKRIERRLHEAGLTSMTDDGVNWQIDRAFAPAILAAPGARPLLHKLADGKERK